MWPRCRYQDRHFFQARSKTEILGVFAPQTTIGDSASLLGLSVHVKWSGMQPQVAMAKKLWINDTLQATMLACLGHFTEGNQAVVQK